MSAPTGAAPEPRELRAPRGARVMEIDWADGRTARYHHRHLRAFCPCAHCQGHQGPIRWHDVDGLDDRAFELVEIEEVGNYALRLVWGDGHASGIYSFRLLRELAALADLPPERARDLRFAR